MPTARPTAEPGPGSPPSGGTADPARADRDAPPRSLADELRSWPDDRLVTLLRARPDLTVPLPPDLTSLAARASSRVSVQRALDGLDTPALQVLEVVAALPEPVGAGAVSGHWGAPASRVLDRLRDLALVWGRGRGVLLVRTVRDVLGPYPAGLGPPLAEALGRRSPQRLAQLLEDLDLPAAGDPETALQRLAAHLGTPGTVHSLLETAPEGARAVLDRLTWGPPVGRVADADRPARRATAAAPLDWLLARGLLAVADAAHVVLPREVGLVLRGGRVHRAAEPAPPAVGTRSRALGTVASTAAAASTEAVRLIEALGDSWGETPPPVLRSGGLGVRELHRTAVALDIDDAAAARAVELAFAAGLVAEDGEADPRWAPTPAFDTWRAGGPGQRWAELAAAWLQTSRCPQLVGTRDERDTPRSALGQAVDPHRPPRSGPGRCGRWRRHGWTPPPPVPVPVPPPAPAGTPWPRSTRTRCARARLGRAAPSGRARDALVGWVLEDAAWLGVTGAGALAPQARPLLADPADLRAAAAALEAVLPAPVDYVLLQADLTAVAPGPLEPELARELGLAADVDSRGGATVYRFSPGSIRRALDAGRSGDDLLAVLTRHSRTEVPQPLRYLIADAARRHGRIRVGAATAYLRADDESALSALLADRRAAALRLRRLAPTVLAAQAPPAVVLEVLRGIGLAPAAEGPDGELVLGRPQQHRTPPRARPRPLSPLPPPPGGAALTVAVEAIRASDEAGRARAAAAAAAPGALAAGTAPPLETTDPVTVLAALREAAERHRAVWIGYADASGQTSRHLVQPLQVQGGRVEAYDRATQQLRTFSVHRVTGVGQIS